MAKKIPMRMCVGCSQMKPKNELIRIVRSPEGEISLDPTGKKSGRGKNIAEDLLFVNRRGGKLTREMVFMIVRKYAGMAGIKNGHIILFSQFIDSREKAGKVLFGVNILLSVC